MVAIGRVVLTSREHIIAISPRGKGLMGTLLRFPYEVRDAGEFFDDIPNVKLTKDMMELARHMSKPKKVTSSRRNSKTITSTRCAI